MITFAGHVKILHRVRARSLPGTFCFKNSLIYMNKRHNLKWKHKSTYILDILKITVIYFYWYVS